MGQSILLVESLERERLQYLTGFARHFYFYFFFYSFPPLNPSQARKAFVDQYYQEHPDEADAAASGDGTRVPPQVMAVFYKQFLAENAENHMTYNFAWWRRNFEQLPFFAAALFSRAWVTLFGPSSSSEDKNVTDDGECSSSLDDDDTE